MWKHLIITLILSVCAARADAAVLHAVLVGDTLDPSLGTGIEQDLKNIAREVRTISKETGLALSLHLIKERDFNTETILHTLDSLDVGAEDVVFFFISCHGFREGDKENIWPNLHVKTPLDIKEGQLTAPVYETLDLYQTSSILINKRPKFLISLANACNVIAPSCPDCENPYPLLHYISWIYPESILSRPNYRRLFLEQKGAILISSSSPGEASLGNVQCGSLFVLNLLEALHEAASGREEADWHLILDRARSKTIDDVFEFDRFFYQTPQFEFILTE